MPTMTSKKEYVSFFLHGNILLTLRHVGDSVWCVWGI